MLNLTTVLPTSKQWHWNLVDTMNWLKTTFIALAPLLLVLIPAALQLIPADWQYGAIVVFILNRIYAAALSFSSEPPKKAQ